jgi:hypothetical protein
MPAAPRIISLNLGSQTLGLAGFHTRPNGGLTLAGYRLREIPAEPAATTERNRQISEALPVMMRELGIKPGPADYAVPGQSVFARFVKLPSVEQDKIERIITFEAQQNVPFPIEEVVWDLPVRRNERGEQNRGRARRDQRKSAGLGPVAACDRLGPNYWKKLRKKIRATDFSKLLSEFERALRIYIVKSGVPRSLGGEPSKETHK